MKVLKFINIKLQKTLVNAKMTPSGCYETRV